jgi:hypothetical protein
MASADARIRGQRATARGAGSGHRELLELFPERLERRGVEGHQVVGRLVHLEQEPRPQRRTRRRDRDRLHPAVGRERTPLGVAPLLEAVDQPRHLRRVDLHPVREHPHRLGELGVEDREDLQVAGGETLLTEDREMTAPLEPLEGEPGHEPPDVTGHVSLRSRTHR